jgi:hypothetical protein
LKAKVSTEIDEKIVQLHEWNKPIEVELSLQLQKIQECCKALDDKSNEMKVILQDRIVEILGSVEVKIKEHLQKLENSTTTLDNVNFTEIS